MCLGLLASLQISGWVGGTLLVKFGLGGRDYCILLFINYCYIGSSDE